MRRYGSAIAVSISALVLLASCATFARREPVDVFLVGVEPLPAQGLELRMNVTLRVQNPNDTPIDYDGISLALDVQGKRFASGVSSASGQIPRFGETTVSVPVSISALRIARQAIGIATNEYRGRLDYELHGKLAGRLFDTVRFDSKGEFTLPEQVLEDTR